MRISMTMKAFSIDRNTVQATENVSQSPNFVLKVLCSFILNSFLYGFEKSFNECFQRAPLS